MSGKMTEDSKGVRVFSTEQDQCIWMKAGVVNFRLCNNAFDCTTCGFDHAIGAARKGEQAALLSWREAMREMPATERDCRHMITGRVDYKICSNDYRCVTCEFDQYLDEADLAGAHNGIPMRKIAGFSIADSYYYSRGHTWARVEHGGFVRLGIDDFACRLLGRPDELHLPRLGAHLNQGEVGWSINRDRNIAEMLSPMRGTVLAANHSVWDQPELAGKDPYGKGWLLVIEPKGLRRNLHGLLFAGTAAGWLQNEANRLDEIVAARYGASMAATGGEVVDDIFGNLTELDWDTLVHAFLGT